MNEIPDENGIERIAELFTVQCYGSASAVSEFLKTSDQAVSVYVGSDNKIYFGTDSEGRILQHPEIAKKIGHVPSFAGWFYFEDGVCRAMVFESADEGSLKTEKAIARVIKKYLNL